MASVRIIRRPKLPIIKNGIYANIDIRDYHSAKLTGEAKSVSSSGLRVLWSKSPAHFFDGWRCNPKGVPTTETEPMLFGRAVHHLFLGEANFKKLFIERPAAIPDEPGGKPLAWQGNRKACRAWLADQKTAGRTVLTAEAIANIRGMGSSISADLVMRDLLIGEIECSMIAKDPETGLWICARPDAIPTTSGDYADMKTAQDVTDFGVQRAITYGGLHQQGALVWELCDLLGMEFTSFNLAFIESARPYCTRIVPIHDDDLSRGRLQNRLALRRIAECIDRGLWPGPGEGEVRSMPIVGRERDYIDARLQLAGLITAKGDV